MENEIRVKGIFEQGYGIIAKALMRDKDLSIEAKSIYSYLASFAGAGNTAFPSVELIIAELNISRDRFYKHRKQLVEKGFITVIQKKGDKGLQQRNIYQLNPILKPQSSFKDTESPQSNYPESSFPQSDYPESDNTYSNNNSLTNNSINNNNINNNSNSAAAGDSNNNLNSELEERERRAAAEIPINLNASPLITYEGSLGLLNAIQREDLFQWEAELSRPIVNFAIYHGSMRGARGYPLINDILRKWHQNNIKSLSEAVAFEKELKNKAQIKGGAYVSGGKRTNQQNQNFDW
ncbi:MULTISPECIES: helix-turn-helix domain-containing protein [Listeria]|uniref:DnaD domain protein n=2 Tax=Listeria monocytogenes TaxID=1639 RepID=A0A6W8FRE4_LISMN|nr:MULTISPECIES: helix-turn-helix domain-containing protein [Listeria]EAC2918966.1 DnaD domain protein [Listeria monocytogenes]EAD3319252.1 DnaD domain protein [Listeria monocytogenes]EAD5983775.1 DnaD domain protein [Listeria monocytogenes]EAE4920297.1 DnaD domain protein [Listeria monocytogenes]EAE6407456.1 DnaD domain protein [Listeria monocytogenes]